jgi:CubicO group peptidase (beta-lactamase class C family)
VPITPATVFDVASVSKQFTGLAVAMLIEQGRVRLDDDIRKYIPELAHVGRPVTIDNLLHHTSGYRDWPGTLSLAGWRMDDIISFDQILSFAYRQHSLNFDPGSEYTYSNTGYNLLAEMVARVTGQSFRAFTDEHLFKPLGMTSTHFRDNHLELIPNRAFGYASVSDTTYRSTPNGLVALGSSSLFTSVDDLAKWVLNFESATVGGATAMAMTRTRGVLTSGATIPYAFGISHGQYRGLATVSHTGSWAQFSTAVVHFPQQHFGVVVLANSSSLNAPRAANNIADIYLEKELGPAPRPAAATSTASVDVGPATLDSSGGLYRLGPGWYTRITRDGGSLRTQATGEQAFPMVATSPFEFWVDGYSAGMTFERGETGQPTMMLYRGRRTPKLPESGPLTLAQLAEFTGEYESDE